MDEERKTEVDLAQELRELGRQLKEAVRVAREHPQTKEFERQVSQAVTELGTQIDRALQSARDEEHLKRAGAQVKQTADALKESGFKEDLQRGLAKGVRVLNQQIARAVTEAEKGPHDRDQGDDATS